MSTRPAALAQQALDLATDYGARSWMPGREPQIVELAPGLVEVSTAARSYRIAQDDGEVVLVVLERGGVIVEHATFSSGLARLVVDYVAEAIR